MESLRANLSLGAETALEKQSAGNELVSPSLDPQLLAALVNRAPFGTYLVDSELRLVAISENSAAGFAGIEQIVGRHIGEILRVNWPEPFATEALGRFQHTLETGEPYHSTDTTEERANVAATESYDWHLERVPLPDDRFGVACYFYETTERVHHAAERNRVEEELRHYQAQLETALKAGRMGSWRFHLIDNRLEASDSCKANFGRAPADEFTFDDRADAIHQEDREHWRRSFDEAIENRRAFEVEYRAIWPDSSIHWISDRGNCSIGPSGETSTVAGITIDITEQKRVERQLLDGIQFNQRVIDSLTSHIAVLDKDGVITAVNEAWRRFARENGADWTMKGVGIGVNYLNVCRTVDGDNSSDAYQIYVGIRDVLSGANELFTFEYPCHSPTQQRWFLLSVSPLGERGGAVVSHTNITERRLAETALRKSQERFDIVKDGAEIGFWFCDLPFDELEWDNRVKEHFWLSPDTRVTIDTFYDRLHPEDRERTRENIENSIANRAYYDIDYRTVSPEGEVKWIRALGRGFYDDAGHPTRFDGVTLDVTQRRQEQMALAAMKFQEAERLRIARDLHDHLGQQLTGLRLSIEDLVSSFGDDEAIGDKIRRLQASAQRLDKDVSSLAFEIRSNSLGDRSLPEALENFVGEWSRNYGIKADFQLINSTTSISLPGEIEINIYRIAQEALNNATKHAKADNVGVLLEIRDSLVRLIVEDDGVGFDPTARRPDPERSSGGMGLVGMKERVELIQGELKIDSTPGEGTTIFVTAPIRSSDQSDRTGHN